MSPPRSVPVGLTTTVAPAGASTSRAEVLDRLADEAVADLAGLLVADHHRVDDLVGAARARRVVRAVEHEQAPRDVEQPARVPLGGEQQRRERLGPPLDRPLGGGARLVDVDPVRRDAHEHVGPCARAQLAGPGPQALGRLVGEVLGQRRDHEAVVVLHRVRLGDDAAEPRLGHLVVGAVHEQQPAAGDARVAELDLVLAGAADELLRVVGQVAAVRVRAVEVLGAHARAVGRLPPERGLRDRGRHAAPHDRVLEAGLRAGSAASARRGRTCRGGSRPPSRRRARWRAWMPSCRSRTMVSPETMNSSMRIIHGPIASRRLAASRRSAAAASGRTSR